MTEGDHLVKTMMHLKEVCGSYPKGQDRDVPPCLYSENTAPGPRSVVEQIKITIPVIVPVASPSIS